MEKWDNVSEVEIQDEKRVKVKILSAGVIKYKDYDIHISEECLKRIYENIKDKEIPVYVEHKISDDMLVGTVKDWQIETVNNSVSLTGNVVLREETPVQRGLIKGLRENAIKSGSVGFSVVLEKKENDTYYFSDILIDEFSFIPPVGYTLTENIISNSVPLSDAGVLAVYLADDRLTFVENKNGDGIFIFFNKECFFTDDVENFKKAFSEKNRCFRVKSVKIDANELSAEKKPVSYSYKSLRQNEIKLNKTKGEYILSFRNGYCYVRDKPEIITHIEDMIKNLSEDERKYLKVV